MSTLPPSYTNNLFGQQQSKEQIEQKIWSRRIKSRTTSCNNTKKGKSWRDIPESVINIYNVKIGEFFDRNVLIKILAKMNFKILRYILRILGFFFTCPIFNLEILLGANWIDLSAIITEILLILQLTIGSLLHYRRTTLLWLSSYRWILRWFMDSFLGIIGYFIPSTTILFLMFGLHIFMVIRYMWCLRSLQKLNSFRKTLNGNQILLVFLLEKLNMIKLMLWLKLRRIRKIIFC